MEYERLPGLKTEDYRYPGDDAAYAVLEKIPLMDKLVEAYMKLVVQTSTLPRVQGDDFRVTAATSPKLHRIYCKALERLDMPQEYPLYVKQDYTYNAMAIGVKDQVIELHASFLTNCPEEELLFVLGHELGHIKSGHVLYYNLAANLTTLLQYLPKAVAQAASVGVYVALMNWRRLQELTADRAGAIAAGGPEFGIQGLARLMGVEQSGLDVHFTLDDLRAQNTAFEEGNEGLAGKLFYALLTTKQSHPWSVARVKAMDQWKTSGEFDQLMARYGVHA